MKPVLMNLDLCPSTIESNSFLLVSGCFVATMDRIMKERKASVTDNIPSAELQELVDDRAVDDQHLERRAPLPVERQCAQQALLHRQFEVGVRKHDAGIFGVEPENRPQAMDFGCLAGADERRHVDLPQPQHPRHDD
jgi:hypothetical protein